MRKGSRVWIFLGGALLLVGHALWIRAVYNGVSLDDAYISYRYADHLAGGAGLTFNAGDRVEGYSNFLWVLVLAALVRPFGDLTLPSQILGLLCSVATLGLCAHALRRLLQVAHPVADIGLALLVAGSGYVAAWAVGGLEGALFGLLLTGAWTSYWIEMERPGRGCPLAALLFAAVSVTRPEGVLIGAAAAVVHVILQVRRGERVFSRAVLLFPFIVLGVIAIYEAWRFTYYGPHLFPNSVRAKTGGGLAHVERGFVYVARQFLVPYALLLAPAFAREVWRRPVLASGFGIFAGYILFVAVAGGDWTSGRLFAPVLPLGAVCTIAWLASSRRATRFASTRTRRRILVLAGAGCVALIFMITSVRREAPFRRNIAAGDTERIAIGRWLGENLPPDALLAVNAAGVIPYYSRLPTHDMYGLTDAHIASLPFSEVRRDSPGHDKFDAAYTLGLEPDVIVDPRQIPTLVRDGQYLRSYHIVEHFWKHHQLAFHRRLLQRIGREIIGTPPREDRR